MRVTISSTIRKDLHPEIRRLVKVGFTGTNDSRVEVHVKGRRPWVRWLVTLPDGRKFTYSRKPLADNVHAGASIERRETMDGRYSGRAYWGVPSIARVRPGTQYLVTMTIPADPTQASYPKTSGSTYKRAPVFEYESWQEQFLHLVAHEANHIRQYRAGRPRSEVRCEQWAKRILDRYRDRDRG